MLLFNTSISKMSFREACGWLTHTKHAPPYTVMLLLLSATYRKAPTRLSFESRISNLFMGTGCSNYIPIPRMVKYTIVVPLFACWWSLSK